MAKKWVIPDIHGCVKSLRELIETQVVPSKEDTLFFLGDYVDRGPDSKGVLDYVMGLQESGYTVVPLKGNHEDFFVKSWEEERESGRFLFMRRHNKSRSQWLKHGGRETLQSFGTMDLLQIPEHYIKWMDELPLYHELEKFLLVHAGLNFEIDDPFQDTFSMLWVKDYRIIPEKIGYRQLIHGHVPMGLDYIYIAITQEGYPFIDLDNGCYMVNRPGYGNLLALELNSMELKIQPNIDME